MSRVVIVTKPTDYELLLHTHGTESAARFELESRGTSFTTIQEAHDRYTQSLQVVGRQIPADTARVYVRREDLNTFPFRETDIVVTVGPDGLFANVARLVENQPIITINPDPKTVEGILALHQPETLGKLLEAVESGKGTFNRIPLAMAETDDGQRVWAVNDFLVGRSDQGTARYTIHWNGNAAKQLSSGVLISTGVGSTGWLRSFLLIAQALSSTRKIRLNVNPERTSPSLTFVVREPITGVDPLFGQVVPGQTLEFVSEMPTGGFITYDGILESPLPFNAGTRVIITPAKRYVNLLVSVEV